MCRLIHPKNLRKCIDIRYVGISVIAILSLICAVPKAVHAREIIIQNDPDTLEYQLDETLVVGADDVLRIMAGTTIRAGENTSIYVRGAVFVGVHSSEGTSLVDAPPVTIISDSKRSFFQIDGGQMILIRTNYIGYSVLEAYRNAQVEMTELMFNYPVYDEGMRHMTVPPVMRVYSSSSVELSYSSIRAERYGGVPPVQPANGYFSQSIIDMFGSSSIKMLDTTIRADSAQYIIITYGKSTLDVDKGMIHSCATWLMLYQYSTATGTLNSPDCTSEPQILFDHATSTLEFTHTTCCSSVMFIPGMQASRLYKRQLFENQLWEPNRELDVEKLYLNTDGNSIVSDIYTRDIIHTTNILGDIFGYSVYSNFISTLEDMRNDKLIIEYSEWAYDWRYDPTRIVDDALIDEIMRLARSSYTGKVSIVAHSYGGLVTKEIMRRLQDMQMSHIVDQLVFVAVPETGAPQSMFSIVHGYMNSIAMKIIAKSSTWMRFAQNLPSLYHVLPHTQYADTLTSYMRIGSEDKATSISLQTSEASQNPAQLLGQSIHARISPYTSTTTIPTILGIKGKPVTKQIPLATGSLIYSTSTNQRMFRDVRNYQQSIASTSMWLNERPKTWSIIGTGIPTITGMNYIFAPCSGFYCKNAGHFVGVPIQSVKGDGTVIYDSISNRVGTQVFIDLFSVNTSLKTNYTHANILEVPYIKDAIRDILVVGHPVYRESSLYFNDAVNMTSSFGKQLSTLAIKGEVTGGIRLQDGANVIETKTHTDEEGYTSSIQNVPNSTLARIGELTYISSIAEPTYIQLQSDRAQSISLFYTQSAVQTGGLGATSGGASSVYTVAQIPVVSGSTIHIDTTAGTPAVVTVQHPHTSTSGGTSGGTSSEASGGASNEQQTSDTYYFSTSTGMSTTTSAGSGTSSVNTATTTVQHALIQDIQALQKRVVESKVRSQQLQTFAYRQYFSKNLTRLEIVLQKMSTRITYVHTSLNSVEKQSMQEMYLMLEDDIEMLTEQDEFYLQLLRINKIPDARVLDATRRRSDITLIYLDITDLQGEVLEFIQKYGSLASERLQRP